MSDYFSDHHHQPPWLRQWFNPNVVRAVPFTFTSYFYYSDHFVVNSGGGHLLHHCYQPISLARPPPPPPPPPPSTTNPRTGAWGRGGKAYFRFHGGIGDGCCGIGGRNNEHNTVARPLQLFDALDPINFQMMADGGCMKTPVIGDLSVDTSGGTGVFLPVYSKRIRSKKGMRVRGVRGDGRKQRHGVMKEEDIFSKPFVGGDMVEKEEHKDISEMPIEMLLPSEWIY